MVVPELPRPERVRAPSVLAAMPCDGTVSFVELGLQRQAFQQSTCCGIGGGAMGHSLAPSQGRQSLRNDGVDFVAGRLDSAGDVFGWT